MTEWEEQGVITEDQPCSRCGCDLRGLAPTERCPACGAPGVNSLILGAGGVVVADQPCSRCGYNLRGLGSTGRCPECAAPVMESLRGDWLACADPDWLAKVRFGTRLKLWNIVLGVVSTRARRSTGVNAMVSSTRSARSSRRSRIPRASGAATEESS